MAKKSIIKVVKKFVRALILRKVYQLTKLFFMVRMQKEG